MIVLPCAAVAVQSEMKKQFSTLRHQWCQTLNYFDSCQNLPLPTLHLPRLGGVACHSAIAIVVHVQPKVFSGWLLFLVAQNLPKAELGLEIADYFGFVAVFVWWGGGGFGRGWGVEEGVLLCIPGEPALTRPTILNSKRIESQWPNLASEALRILVKGGH